MKQPGPCIVVIFGASGDLAKRKLFPALQELQAKGLIPDKTVIVGTSRTEYPGNELEGHPYISGDSTDPNFMRELKSRLEEIDEEAGTEGNRVWYLATAPNLFAPIVEGLGKAGLGQTGGWQRLVVEKPFGRDLESAQDLNRIVQSHFDESLIFRIDHYLGKETVQNLLVFRFANAIFEPIWNRRYIDHVQITVGETDGVGSRGAFYDHVGALRDVGQNHLLQLLALTAIEPPVAWDADSIRSEKVQVLRAVRRWDPDECATCVARGRYDGYTEEADVKPDSKTETFVAAKLFIDNWRWADVPFYVRTGKKLATKDTEIVIQFKAVPHLLFKKTEVERIDPNVLVIRIQPDEGFSLTFGTKVPGPEVNVRTVDMEFMYEQDFGSGTPEAYERLLLDCMLGDATLFTRADEIEQAWEIVDPILEHFADAGPPESYEAGTWGPSSAHELLAHDGRGWREPTR